MTDHRPDIPELPPFHYWNATVIPTDEYPDGFPVLEVRRRTLFGSRLVIRQGMGEMLFEENETLQNHIYEDAMHKLGERMEAMKPGGSACRSD